MAHRHGTWTQTRTQTRTQTWTQTWYQPQNHKKKTSGGIYAILNCFSMYKIKIGPETDTAAASASASEMNYKIIC